MTRFYVAALAAAFALAATAADAHPRLTDSTPAAGSTMKNSPTSIRMNFSEGLIPRFTGLVLKDGSARSYDQGGRATTSEVGDRVAETIRGLPA